MGAHLSEAVLVQFVADAVVLHLDGLAPVDEAARQTGFGRVKVIFLTGQYQGG